jgi:hypothetical protein
MKDKIAEKLICESLENFRKDETEKVYLCPVSNIYGYHFGTKIRVWE